MGEPIGKAVLTLRSTPAGLAFGRPPVETGDDGGFTFAGLRPGRYSFSIDHPSYAGQSFPTPFSVGAGRQITGIDIVLQSKAVLSGRLSDVDGDPIEGIPVVAFRASYREGRRQLSVAESNITDDRGVFRLAGLEAGRYYLAADRYPPNQWAGALRGVQPIPDDPVETLHVTTFYPSALDESGAEAFDLAPGDEILDVNFSMLRQPVYSIEGVVVDGATGQPVAGARIVQLPSDGQLSAEIGDRAITDASGAFRFHNIPGGKLSLAVIAGSGQIGSSSCVYRYQMNTGEPGRGGLASIDVTGDMSGVRIELSTGTELRGRVRIEDGTEEGGDVADLVSSSSLTGPLAFLVQGFSVSLRPVGGFSLNLVPAQFESGGRFTIRDIMPDEYVVDVQELSADSGLYVQSIEVGGQDGSRGPLRFDGRSEPLNITLAYGAPALRVQARDGDGNGVAGAHVSLRRANPIAALASGNVRSGITDQSGFADFPGLAQDVYYAIAWAELPDPGLALYPEFLRLFEDGATEIDLTSASIESLELEVVSGDRGVDAFANLP